MQERGRNYFDTTKDRGRYLDAGFHSLMGYFRDDRPLYELILDEKQQARARRDVAGDGRRWRRSTSRHVLRSSSRTRATQGGGRGSVTMPPNPNQEPITSEAADHGASKART